MKYNRKIQNNIDRRSEAFRYQKARREILRGFNDETYIFLSTLFGTHIEEGKKRISDYGNMTMFDVVSEIKMRTMMLQGYNRAKIRHHFEEEKRKQDELLARLKASQK